MPIVLASASPRRAAILKALGVSFRVVVADVDESILAAEGADAAAERLARLKARTVAGRVPEPVLAADTLVVCEARVLGKPADAAEAASMLRLLQGRSHQVVTGVCLVADGIARSGVDRTDVRFAPMTEAEIAWYVATREPMDKAGAYHVDGRGALFLEAVAGSPSNVAGLPVRLVLRLLRESGLALVPW